MKKEEIEAIKRQCAAATPGPWTVDFGFNIKCGDGYGLNADGDFSAEHEDAWRQRKESNADFIAHARTDVPSLVAEVERLRQVLSAHLEYQKIKKGDFGRPS
jgi:hypothetical protein